MTWRIALRLRTRSPASRLPAHSYAPYIAQLTALQRRFPLVGHKYGYREFNEAQFQALVPLVARIVKRYDIPRANVIGHSDVAPARKIDPGELFPWDRLAEYGLCLPRPQKLERGDPFDNDAAFYLALERFGYDVTDGHKAVEAFQRRWRPEKINGEIDGEVRAILFQLLLDRDRGHTR